MTKEHVLLFGLSADPPTGERGHLGLVRWAAERVQFPELSRPVDRIWVLPVHRHAFTAKSSLSPFVHRLAMARTCFGDLQSRIPVEVSDMERELAQRGDGPIGTIDLVEYLEAQHVGIQLSLLLGADTANDLFTHRWRRAEELLQRVGVLVVPRVGVPLGEGVHNRVCKDAPALGAVSSTEARMASGHALRALVTPAVATYIERHELYPKEAM